MNKMKSLFTDKNVLGETHFDFATVITLIGLVLATLGIDPISIQSWDALKVLFIAFISNPYKIGLVAVALYGWFRNNQQEEVTANVGRRKY